MRVLFALLGIAPLFSADSVRVDVIHNEVWITRNPESSTGVSKQLTHDRKAKIQAELSSALDRIAYYEECPDSEHCKPSVVILDLEGNRLQTFQPHTSAFGSDETCGSILHISWLRGSTIGVECHATPSESLYIEFDLAARKNVRDLVGLDFTPSPDGKFVAHVGPLPHFAPPYAKSYFLFLDDAIVYPLPKGAKPFRWNINGEKPDIVQIRGDRFVGIHAFASRFAWSPNSTRVAFLDCIFDWVQKEGEGDESGIETNRRCSIAVVSPSGALSLVPLRGAPLTGDISWLDDRQLRITFPAASTHPGPPPRTIRIPWSVLGSANRKMRAATSSKALASRRTAITTPATVRDRSHPPQLLSPPAISQCYIATSVARYPQLSRSHPHPHRAEPCSRTPAN